MAACHVTAYVYTKCWKVSHCHPIHIKPLIPGENNEHGEIYWITYEAENTDLYLGLHLHKCGADVQEETCIKIKDMIYKSTNIMLNFEINY